MHQSPDYRVLCSQVTFREVSGSPNQTRFWQALCRQANLIIGARPDRGFRFTQAPG